MSIQYRSEHGKFELCLDGWKNKPTCFSSKFLLVILSYFFFQVTVEMILYNFRVKKILSNWNYINFIKQCCGELIFMILNLPSIKKYNLFLYSELISFKYILRLSLYKYDVFTVKFICVNSTLIIFVTIMNKVIFYYFFLCMKLINFCLLVLHIATLLSSLLR